jgi:hypothetical protein
MKKKLLGAVDNDVHHEGAGFRHDVLFPRKGVSYANILTMDSITRSVKRTEHE